MIAAMMVAATIAAMVAATIAAMIAATVAATIAGRMMAAMIAAMMAATVAAKGRLPRMRHRSQMAVEVSTRMDGRDEQHTFVKHVIRIIYKETTCIGETLSTL